MKVSEEKGKQGGLRVKEKQSSQFRVKDQILSWSAKGRVND